MICALSFTHPCRDMARFIAMMFFFLPLFVNKIVPLPILNKKCVWKSHARAKLYTNVPPSQGVDSQGKGTTFVWAFVSLTWANPIALKILRFVFLSLPKCFSSFYL